jgi:mRNA-degrading endonuclease RelE of RelBE toxin-antitoxin system
MAWKVTIGTKAQKQIKKLNYDVVSVFRLLVDDLAHFGPIPGKQWPNYGKLKVGKKEDKRHCHLIKGKPTYVCCWEVVNKNMKIMEVYYVGTHEKSPY